MTLRRGILVLVIAVGLLATYMLLFGESKELSEPVVSSSPESPAVQDGERLTSARWAGDSGGRLSPDILCSDGGGIETSELLENSAQQSETREETERRISQTLAASSSPEHLYAAALLESDPAKKAELLERVVAGAPTNAFLVWSAYNICSAGKQPDYCAMDLLEEALIRVDGGNSETWARIATNQYAAGDHYGALDSMRKAATSAQSLIYYAESIESFERSLAAVGGLSFEERAHMAMGMSAAVPLFFDFFEMCRQMSSDNAEWAHTCLSYGQLLENQGMTEIGAAVARSLQKSMFEMLGDAEGVKIVEARRQAYRRVKDHQHATYDPAVEYLLFTNPEVFHSYVSAFRMKGESIAWEQLRTEVAERLKAQPELACVPERYWPADQG